MQNSTTILKMMVNVYFAWIPCIIWKMMQVTLLISSMLIWEQCSKCKSRSKSDEWLVPMTTKWSACSVVSKSICFIKNVLKHISAVRAQPGSVNTVNDHVVSQNGLRLRTVDWASHSVQPIFIIWASMHLRLPKMANDIKSSHRSSTTQMMMKGEWLWESW